MFSIRYEDNNMPRFVRPSWVEVLIDGRARFASGPKSKAGSSRVRVRVRDDGQIVTSLVIECRSTGDQHEVTVFDRDGKIIYRHLTDLS